MLKVCTISLYFDGHKLVQQLEQSSVRNMAKSTVNTAQINSKLNVVIKGVSRYVHTLSPIIP